MGEDLVGRREQKIALYAEEELVAGRSRRGTIGSLFFSYFLSLSRPPVEARS